jgi:hypothetical protein
MAKESKFFRKQADKAERKARAVSDVEISQSFLNMAKAYRSQAGALKTKKPKKPLSNDGDVVSAVHRVTPIAARGLLPGQQARVFRY